MSSTRPSVTIVVPARLGSTRFPEKVLASATGRPMVQHVVDAAKRVRGIDAVVVATDSERVAAALAPFGTRVVMTAPTHPNGTSRLAEAAGLLGLHDDAVVVNAQGDEPEMPPTVIEGAVRALIETPGASVGTACTVLGPDESPENPNIVKVVRDSAGRALYFSRSRIPFEREAGHVTVLRHVGVYAYRVSFLRRYVAMPISPLEQAESLEQLRVLEHGYTIAVARCDEARGLTGIDTPEQYAEFVKRWEKSGASSPGRTY